MGPPGWGSLGVCCRRGARGSKCPQLLTRTPTGDVGGTLPRSGVVYAVLGRVSSTRYSATGQGRGPGERRPLGRGKRSPLASQLVPCAASSGGLVGRGSPPGVPPGGGRCRLVASGPSLRLGVPSGVFRGVWTGTCGQGGVAVGPPSAHVSRTLRDPPGGSPWQYCVWIGPPVHVVAVGFDSVPWWDVPWWDRALGTRLG